MNSRRSYTAKFCIVSASCGHILLVSARIARVVESPSLSENRDIHRHNMACAQAIGGLSIAVISAIMESKLFLGGIDLHCSTWHCRGKEMKKTHQCICEN